MGEKWKITGLSAGAVAGIILFVFCIGLLGLGYYKFFAPRYANVEREVFEQTQSYVHGKIQDLAKYKEEYDAASTEDREAIRQTIILRFAEFDEAQIKSSGLKEFLIGMRGY